MNQIIQIWDLVGLFILCSYVQCSCPNQLQVFLRRRLLRQVQVDYCGRGIQSLREHFEFVVEINDPIQKNPSHFFIYLNLSGHVVLELIIFLLLRHHELETVIKVVTDKLDVFR